MMRGVGGLAGYGMAGNPVFVAVHAALGLITWFLIVAILVAVLRWLWKKGDK